MLFFLVNKNNKTFLFLGGSTLDRDNLEAELEAVKSARRRYNILEAELLAGKRAGGFTERQRIQNELAALRESRKGSSLNKINFGVGGGGMGGRSKSSSDLDADTVREMRRSKAKARAMFESQAPKYKFGGSGEKLLSEEDDELMLRPRRPRAAQQQQNPKEERKWVADTINKYFDVIVEEEEEATAEHGKEEYEDDDENKEIFYPDSDDDDYDEDMDRLGKGEQFKSTSNIRGLLSHVLGRVSRSNAGASKEALVGALKQNLGTQMGGTTDL